MANKQPANRASTAGSQQVKRALGFMASDLKRKSELMDDMGYLLAAATYESIDACSEIDSMVPLAFAV